MKLALGHGSLSSLTSEVAHQSTLPARTRSSRVYNIHSIWGGGGLTGMHREKFIYSVLLEEAPDSFLKRNGKIFSSGLLSAEIWERQPWISEAAQGSLPWKLCSRAQRGDGGTFNHIAYLAHMSAEFTKRAKLWITSLLSNCSQSHLLVSRKAKRMYEFQVGT